MGRGEVSFWYDNWSSLGPLFMEIDNNESLSHILLKEVFINGRWEWDKLETQLDNNMKSRIMELHISLDEQKKDKAVWTPTTDGKFTVGSAWDICGQKRRRGSIEGNIWQRAIPFKMSFITWRAIHNNLATDDKIARLGIKVNSTCSCCDIANQTQDLETVEHLFCFGDHAKRIWHIFAGALGIAFRNIPLKMILLNWWNHKAPNPITAFILKILPPIICWEIWRTRCSNKYGAEKPSVYRSQSNILFSILQMLRSNLKRSKFGNSWKSICQATEEASKQRGNMVVKWIKAPVDEIKLNTDESCVNGQYGGGGII